jgi:hypothetical protein
MSTNINVAIHKKLKSISKITKKRLLNFFKIWVLSLFSSFLVFLGLGFYHNIFLSFFFLVVVLFFWAINVFSEGIEQYEMSYNCKNSTQ